MHECESESLEERLQVCIAQTDINIWHVINESYQSKFREQAEGHINPVCQPKTATDATNLLLPLIITKRNRPETILKTQSQGNKGNLRASTYKECTSKYLGRSKGDYASHRRQQQNNANSSLRQGLPSIEKQRPVCAHEKSKAMDLPSLHKLFQMALETGWIAKLIKCSLHFVDPL
ncbi:hypothetical protein AB4K20DRAFT_1863100 [Rhizopus microsporus]